MANNKTTYTLQIDAEINSLEKKLGSIQNLMQGVMNSADAPKGLEKSFEKIGSLIDKIRAKASAPIDSKSGFTSIGKDIEAVNIALGSLYKMIGSVGEMSEASRISFLPPEAQKEIATIIKSIETYEAAIASATAETAELIEARKELAKAEVARSKADADLELKQQGLDRAKSDLKAADSAIKAIEERKKALDGLLKKQEEIEKFYNTEGADGKKPNRSKKYDGISMRPQDIKRQIKNQEALMVGDAEELEKQSKALKQAKIDIESYERQVGTAQRRWNDANETFNAATKAVETLNAAFKSGSIEKKQVAYTALKAEASKLGIAVSDLNDEFSETDANILTQRLIELKQKGLAPVTDAMDRAQAETREMGDTAKQAGKDVKESAEAYKEMNDAVAQQDAFENKIKSFLGVAGAAQVMRHALRDAMQTITELDKTMTEMSVVTDLKVSDYWDQLPQYTKRANELGLAINDVYKADTLYYQQGLKTNEVVAISTETMKMARIAGLDTAEATDRMTAALRGFNMELNETSAAKIADVYSELAAITAADVDEISTAMTKTASIASSAGMEFETTAAFLSQIIETTRESAETAGTAMKTVIARFQELKKTPEDIGEVDGEIVDANAIETALRSVGVELRDAGGQFRELDDVFLELSKKWNTLDKNTQRYIATIAAGSRQQSRFIAMMSDYERTQDLVTAANNSAGASNRQFEKTMDSLESKIEKLKNTWHEFTMGIMNSDLVKAGVDILTKFLQIINNITSAFDGIGGSLAKIGSVLAIFKLGKVIFEKFRPMIGTFLMSIVDDYKKAGEDAGGKFASGVKKGVQKAEEGENQTGTIDQKSKEEEQRKPGSIERVAGNTPNAKIANMGIGIMESVGVGHFADAAAAHNNKKAAQKKLAKAQDILGTNETVQKVKQKDYEKNKQLLSNYTVQKNGAISKKGTKGFLSGDEAKEAKEQISQATKEVELYENALKDAEEAGGEIENASKGQWESISSGLESASMAAAGVGMAFGAIGQAFTDAGLEEVGSVISGIGTAFMVLSTVMQVASSIIPLLSTAFGAAGAAGTASGVATTAAWGPVGLIVMAVMAGIIAVVAIVLVVLQAIKNASPEKKLEDMQNAAANAAQAADEAAEAYDKLADSLDGLEGQYKKLEDLTRGTKEWNEAVRDINSSVLKLISEYPELAKFVENKEGVLTIDVQGDEVQDVLQEAEAKKIVAANYSVLADAEVSKAQNNVNFGQLQGVKDVANLRGWEDAATALNPIAAGIKTYELTSGGFGGVMAGIGTSLLSSMSIIGQAGTAAINGSISSAQTAGDKKLQDAVGKLSTAVMTGEIGTNKDEMYNKLIGLGVDKEEANLLAKSFTEDVDSLISYGQTIESANLQQQAAYDSIASSAQALANTLTMTGEQIQQSSVLVDGDLSGELYEKKMKDLEGVDLNKDLENNPEVLDAIQKTYGVGAKIDKNGKVTYVKDGENKEVTLTAEQIKSMIATEYATNESAKAIEYSDDAIEAAASVIGEDAINNLYMSNEGGALRKEDVGVLEGALGSIKAEEWNDMANTEKEKYASDLSALPESVRKAWEEMGENSQSAYGNDITKFIDDLAEGVEIANEAFSDAGDAVRDFMTADMAKAWKNKLEEVNKGAQVYADGTNSAKIEEVTDKLMSSIVDSSGQIDKDKQAEIQNRINMTDWSNLEDLLSLQLDLVDVYGMDIEVAKEYTSVLATVSHATSNLVTTIEAFGASYQANEKVERSLKKITDLQWEYNRALEKGSGNVSQLIADQIKAYQEVAEGYEDRYRASSTNLEKILARAYNKESFGGHALSDYFTVREDGSLDTSKGKNGLSVQDLYSIVSESEKENIKQLLQEYEEEYKLQQDSLKGLRDTIDGINDLKKQSEDAYYGLRDLAKNAVLDSLQKQIDLQSDLLDATNNASSQLINKIQEQINETRQTRQNEETEKNIEDLRSQAAYLSMDTSSGNALEQLALEEQIAQAERDYQETLVDQSIQSLQDANERAAEQRERQIVIAEQQLQAYSESKKFQEDIDAQLAAMIAAGESWTDTTLGETITEYATKEMSNEEIKAWGQNITSQIGSASWRGIDWQTYTDPMKAAINGLPDGIAQAITAGSASRAVNQQATSLTEANFDLGALGITKDEKGNFVSSSGGEGGGTSAISGTQQASLDQLAAVQSRDSDTGKISELQSSISGKISRAKEHGMDSSAYETMDQSTFYNDYTDQFAKNGKAEVTIHGQKQEVTSYTDYLNKVNAKELEGIDNLSAMEAYGGAAVSGTTRYLTAEEWKKDEQANFDMKVGGSDWDNSVTTSQNITGNVAKTLTTIYNNTGGDSLNSGVLITKADGHHGLGGYGDTNNSGGYNLWVKHPTEPGIWRWVVNQGEDGSPTPYGLTKAGLAELETKPKKYTKYKFKTGGLADFTGPAWLDGTPSKPEYILNAAQTERFFSLIDVLESLDDKGKGDKASGDNYFEIEINVEKLESDYDVEKIANKIRSMIYEDASYRNVNAINLIR